jgi:hypothetical protein
MAGESSSHAARDQRKDTSKQTRTEEGRKKGGSDAEQPLTTSILCVL